MKTRKYIVAAMLLVVAVAVILVGCKKEKLEYSCNPIVNDWAKENAELFEKSSRKQLATLPMPLLHAAYNTLSPQKKYDLWQEKLAIEFNIWGDSLQEKIKCFANTISVSWYDESPKCDCNYDFLEHWESEILTNYLDTIDYVIAFCMLPTIDEIYELNEQPELINYDWIQIPDELLTKNVSRSDGQGGSPSSSFSCNCRVNAACTASPLGNQCVKTNCVRKKHCGLGGFFECTGECAEKQI